MSKDHCHTTMRIVLSIFFVSIMLIGDIYAQSISGDATNEDSDFSKMLPSLGALIDSALIHSPAMRIADNTILLSQYELKQLNKDWMKWIYLQGDARYGSDFYFSTEQVLIDYSDQERPSVRYGVGLNMRMPISEVLNRKLPRQEAKINIEQARAQKEIIENNIRQLVITAYYDLLTQQKTLDLQIELLSSASMTFDQAKMDYAGNKISLKDYTQSAETFIKTQNAYEIEKNNYSKALRLMEALVGIKIIK